MKLSGYIYNCSGGETWDIIAKEVYGHETYAADVLCANPALCEKTVFVGGEKVRLPVIDTPETMTTTEEETPPWRR